MSIMADSDIPQIGNNTADDQRGGNIPGLRDLMFQPNQAGRGIWDPIEKVMKGSTNPEDFLRLTIVDAAAVGRHQRIMYVKNLARHGNGRLEEVMWSGYNLRCSVGGELLDLIGQMVTGQRQQRNEDWKERRLRAAQQASSGNPMANNTQKLNVPQ